MAEDRLRGVMDACIGLGSAPPVVLRTSLEIAAAARAVTGWTSESVMGVCAFNDDTAMAVLAGMREQGLADLAVIGADNIPTSPSPRSTHRPGPDAPGT
ncbi:substrate-binding domain-containing protein [Streptomyces sp. NPDC005474]|uniref:substrate-binding domain-containing protein n=1 Tax=Streptomyces sp. NPDC005474 TaxID=3154878 RepID=UPI0034564280